MSDLAYLVAPSLAFLVAAGSPGPATLAVAATAMARGRRAGMATGLGLGLGLAFWGVIAAAGLGAAILAWAPALVVLRLAGGAFLLWLAWKSAKSALQPDVADDPSPLPDRALFRRGLLLNLLNPKAVLAWGAVIAIGLPQGAGPAEFAAIVAVCSAIGVALYAIYAVAFSMPPVRGWYTRARRGIEAACALSFGLAGIRLMLWRGGAS